MLSFLNLEKDALLIIPMIEKRNEREINYKNLSEFTKNASFGKQTNLWQEVMEQLHFNIRENPDCCYWLSTHGKGVAYLHVRIDLRPKYFLHCDYFYDNYQLNQKTEKKVFLLIEENKQKKTFYFNAIFFFATSFFLLGTALFSAK